MFIKLTQIVYPEDCENAHGHEADFQRPVWLNLDSIESWSVTCVADVMRGGATAVLSRDNTVVFVAETAPDVARMVEDAEERDIARHAQKLASLACRGQLGGATIHQGACSCPCHTACTCDCAAPTHRAPSQYRKAGQLR